MRKGAPSAPSRAGFRCTSRIADRSSNFDFPTHEKGQTGPQSSLCCGRTFVSGCLSDGPEKNIQKRPGTLPRQVWLQGGGAPSRIFFVKERSLNKSTGQLTGLNIGESQALLGDGAKQRENAWWERAVIYQIAVQSFQDSNGDGKGDLRGLISRIDYLSWL